jgi:formylglycine-generating enzyme
MALTISVPDSLRASVEAASGGRQTVLYTAKGNPTFMNVIPQFNLADVGLTGTTPHPAFIVNGVNKTEIFLGTYAGKSVDGELLSLPGVECSHNDLIGLTGTHDNYITRAAACGTGFHLMNNIEWAAIALWCRQNSYAPTGNTSTGKAHDRTWESGRLAGEGRILNGSGPVSWRHDNSSTGISDLCGNVWEWAPGLRVTTDQYIQIIQNNNAAVSASSTGAGSGDWHYININGSLSTTLDAGTAIKFGTVLAANTVVAAGTFEGLTVDNSITAGALAVLRNYGILPISNQLGGTIASPAVNGDYFVLGGAGNEYIPFRGGDWTFGPNAGVWALHLYYARTTVSSSVGGRPAFVS